MSSTTAGNRTAQTTQNAPEAQSVLLKVYDGVLITGELILVFIKMILTWYYCMYRLVVPPEPKSLKGEIALMTGAGHGMGREVALRLARLGALVVCVDINPTGNQETVDMIKADNGKAVRYECDITDRDAVNKMAEKVRKEVGEVTMLFNNAGIMPCKPIMKLSENEIRKVFDINCVAHLWMLQAFLPSMMERNHGHIVAMSSMAGMMGFRNVVPYCGTKYGVRGMMEALSEELREDPRDFSGIQFTTICPYIVDTGLAKNPNIKFPSLMKIVSPTDAADDIVDAVRRNYDEITIPSDLYYSNLFGRVFPRKVMIYIKDFIGTGLDPHPE